MYRWDNAGLALPNINFNFLRKYHKYLLYNIDGITVCCSSRVQPASDEQPSTATQSMTTTEASSDDVLMASNQVEVGPISGGRGWELEVHR